MPTDIDNMTTELGVYYMKEMERDKPAFIESLKKYNSIASAAKYFYDYAVGNGIIPAIETLSVVEKEKYWRQTEGDKEKRIKICKGLYALETMLPLITQPQNLQ